MPTDVYYHWLLQNLNLFGSIFHIRKCKQPQSIKYRDFLYGRSVQWQNFRQAHSCCEGQCKERLSALCREELKQRYTLAILTFATLAFMHYCICLLTNVRFTNQSETQSHNLNLIQLKHGWKLKFLRNLPTKWQFSIYLSRYTNRIRICSEIGVNVECFQKVERCQLQRHC